MRSPTSVSSVCALFLFACHGSAAAPQPLPATSATSSSSPPTPEPGRSSALASGSTSDPFPVSSPSVAWFVLGWDTSADAAAAALEKAGAVPKRTSNEKGGFTNLAVERGDWSATAYFNLAGTSMFQIATTNSSASNEIGEGARARLTARFGAPASTTRGVESVWRRDGGPAVTVKMRVSAGKVSLLEEWIRAEAKGPVGFAGLDWEMPPQKIKAALKSAGLEVAEAKPGKPLPHANAPNAANGPDAPPLLRFHGKGRDGEASFSAAGGLTQLVVRAEALRDEAEAATRIDELKKSLGSNPTMVTKESSAHWSSPATEIELTIQEKMPGAAWTVRENYTPRKKY